MNIIKRVKAFGKLSDTLHNFLANYASENNNLKNALELASSHNRWFTVENIMFSIASIAKSIEINSIETWLKNYNFPQNIKNPKTVGIVMAGNLPLVGFHDFFYVLMSGNKVFVKLSSDDKYLLPTIAKQLIDIEPGFANLIVFTENRLVSFDAIIATGSNNTARYFEYYFGKYPHIIRKNRNGIAVISGNESKEEIEELCHDITRYFGMGCRNVSKLFVPKDYNFNELLDALTKYSDILDTNKYYNNYEYFRSIYLINLLPFYDNGSTILKEEKLMSSPISVVYYEFYDYIIDLNQFINENKDQIQCVVSNNTEIYGAIPFGSAQSPTLTDYADGVDVMEFLLRL